MFGSAALVSFALSPFATAASDPFVIPNVWDDIDEKSMADEVDIDIDEILKSAPTSTAIVVGDLVGKDYTLSGGGEEVNVKFVKTGSEGKTVFNPAGGGAAFDSLTLSSGSTTTLRVDTDLHNADLLGGGTLSIEEGARLIISSTGDKPLIGRSITLAYFDGSNEELHLAEGNISLKGKALLPYKAGDLYFEDGRLMLRLLAQTRNVYISPNMPKNARAGAALLWALELANHKPTQAGSHLAAVRDVVQQAYDENAMGKVTHTLAAVAGASTAVLSNALAQDVRRQLESVRNRCAMADTSSGLHFRITGETAYHKLDADGLAPGFTLNGWGGSVGVDADLSSRTACGLAISAMYNDLKTSSADNGDLDTAYLSAYARTTRGKWNHSLTATVGTADVSFNRTVNYGPSGSYSAQGATDGLAFGIMYEVGYSFILKRHANMLLQPVMNVQYSHAAFSGYTESGTDAALRVDDMEQNQLTLGLGARLQRTLGENAFNRPAFFEGRALAKVELGDRSGSASTTIAGARIAPAEVESAKVGALGIELGVGISLPLSQQRSTIFADASAEFRTGYTTFNATLGYQITF